MVVSLTITCIEAHRAHIPGPILPRVENTTARPLATFKIIDEDQPDTSWDPDHYRGVLPRWQRLRVNSTSACKNPLCYSQLEVDTSSSRGFRQT